MFKCNLCKKTSKAGEAQITVVTKVREKLYLNESKTEKGYKTSESRGWEVAEEAKACASCAPAQQAKVADMVAKLNPKPVLATVTQ